jgi:hypothetical protein
MANKPLYKPPTRVATIEMPFISIVQRSDPSWAHYKHREVEYQFSRREFWADPYIRGPYNPVFDNPVEPLAFAFTDETGAAILTSGGSQIIAE